MTSQIVEEQTDFVEEQIKEFEKKDCFFTDDYDNKRKLHTNRDVTEEVKQWIRSFASTLIEREREKERESMNFTFETFLLNSPLREKWQEFYKQLTPVCTKLREKI